MQDPQQGTPPPFEPSRRRPPRAPAADAIPIPEAAAGRTRPGPAGVQDVLAAHQRAVDARIEEGLREIRLAVAGAVGRAAQESAPAPPLETPERPAADDVVRGLVAHTEERFQALSLRLRRIEDVLRSISKREGPELDQALDGLRRSITSIATTQQQEFARLAQVQRQAAERIARMQRSAAEALAKQQRAAAEILLKEHRAALDDLAARMGRGIAAVARKLQDDLQARQDALLERYLRGLARELRRQQERHPMRPSPARARPTTRPSETPPGAGDTEPEPTPAPAAAAPPVPDATTEAPAAASSTEQEPTGTEPRPKPPPRRYLIERKHPAPETPRIERPAGEASPTDEEPRPPRDDGAPEPRG